MAIICSDYNLLFLMAPRTGCTAVGTFLEHRLGGRYLPSQDILNADGSYRVQMKHSTLKALLENQLLTLADVKRLLKVTCVRNPFDSLVSLYVKKRTKYRTHCSNPDNWVYRLPGYVKDIHFCQTHSFSEWIEKHYNNQTWYQWLRWPLRCSLYGAFTEGADVVLRFETLQNDFAAFLDRIGYEGDPTLPHVNATESKELSYQQYYSFRAKRIVNRVFRSELRRYHYVF